MFTLGNSEHATGGAGPWQPGTFAKLHGIREQKSMKEIQVSVMPQEFCNHPTRVTRGYLAPGVAVTPFIPMFRLIL